MKRQVYSAQALYWSALVFGAAITPHRLAFAERPEAPSVLGVQNPSAPSRLPRIGVFGGYSAYNLSNPGAHVGVEYPLLAAPRFQSIAMASFHVHHQADTQTGYAFHLRWGQRYTAPSGLTIESYLGLGLQITDYDTTSFEFSDGVAVQREGSEARFGITPHVVFGPGYDFASLLEVPVHLYVRPGVQLLYPDLNLALQVSGTVEAGVRWTFE